MYGAYSARGAASSRALFVRVPTDTIITAAGWSAQLTFAKHYHKAIRQFGKLAKALLGDLSLRSCKVTRLCRDPLMDMRLCMSIMILN